MSFVDTSERLVARPRNEKLSGSPAEDVIIVEGLRMRYRATEAVAGIDLRVGRGEIFAFLGPNGAGKTTTVEILEGFRERSEGEVCVLGVDPSDGSREWRNRIGVGPAGIERRTGSHRPRMPRPLRRLLRRAARRSRRRSPSSVSPRAPMRSASTSPADSAAASKSRSR